MDAFKWNKSFVTGLDSVDSQHKKLVNILNKLGSYTINNNLTFKQVSILLKELIEYSVYHFNDEQEIMSQFKVDSRHTSEHIRIHNSFITEIENLTSSIREDSKQEYDELFDYLMHWLAYHILGIDQEMARQIQLIKKGVAPEEAYKIEKDRDYNIAEPLLNALKGLFKRVTKQNLKLVELNRELESKVKARTQELENLNIHLETLSLTDQLTGLKNRRFALTKLSKLWIESTENDTELTCMMIDADNFKEINDNYGHDAGDIVIKELGKILEGSISLPDIVCRLGGDEFIIICPGKDKTEGFELAKEIKQRVNSKIIKAGKGEWKGSVSIGISSRVYNTRDFNELIKHADNNVYEAKRAGKNCIKYYNY